METLKSAKNKFIDDFFKKHNHLPSDKILNDFRIGYRKFYFKNYEKNKRTRKRINLTLTQKEFNLLDFFSRRYNNKKSTIAKEIILKYLRNEKFLNDDIEDKLQETIIQLRKIGNNINQLTKLSHQYPIGSATHTRCFEQALNYLATIEKKIINSIVKKK